MTSNVNIYDNLFVGINVPDFNLILNSNLSLKRTNNSETSKTIKSAEILKVFQHPAPPYRKTMRSSDIQ
jgi:hypothetical protein